MFLQILAVLTFIVCCFWTLLKIVGWLEIVVFCYMLKLVCLSGRISIEGNSKLDETKAPLLKKKRRRVAYKGHLTKV